MVLSRFERRLERLVEGTFSKAFRSGLQPVELARRLVREIEVGRTLGVKGPVAPNHFVIRLSAPDMERFEAYHDALVTELVEAVRDHARDERYGFVGPVVIEMEADERLKLGNFKVSASIDANVAGRGAALTLPDGGRLRLDTELATTIGRLPECTLRLTDAEVSRHHAEVSLQPDGWHVRDLGSTNGTIVNGTNTKSARLSDGDVIVLGTTQLTFRLG